MPVVGTTWRGLTSNQSRTVYGQARAARQERDPLPSYGRNLKAVALLSVWLVLIAISVGVPPFSLCNR